MLLTCKCLNISMNVGYTAPADDKELDLLDVEITDPFFSKKLKSVLVQNIMKAQESLISVHNIGSWVLHKCLNCKLDVYASRKEEIVVSPDLLVDEAQIKELRQSSSFSPVFNIVLQPNNSADLSARLNSRPLSNSDPLARSTRLVALNQQVSSYLQKLSSNVEEKIRQFSEEQYSLLEKERTKVQMEHRSLVKIVNDTDNTNNNSDSPLVFTPYQIKSSLNDANNLKRVSKPAAVSSSSSSGRNSSDASDDFMFELEDIEDPVRANTAGASEEETSDTDDSGSHDEGIHIPRSLKQEECSIAKSLPMNIPAFQQVMINNGREVRAIPKKKVEDDFRETQDIAASIKALARSVHGDTPFGDLPRPRLGSHI